jgi:hypothetical protein
MSIKGMQLSPRSTGLFWNLVTCSGIADPARSVGKRFVAMEL